MQVKRTRQQDVDGKYAAIAMVSALQLTNCVGHRNEAGVVRGIGAGKL